MMSPEFEFIFWIRPDFSLSQFKPLKSIIKLVGQKLKKKTFEETDLYGYSSDLFACISTWKLLPSEKLLSM